jgi:hypothetical protein
MNYGKRKALTQVVVTRSYLPPVVVRTGMAFPNELKTKLEASCGHRAAGRERLTRSTRSMRRLGRMKRRRKYSPHESPSALRPTDNSIGSRESLSCSRGKRDFQNTLPKMYIIELIPSPKTQFFIPLSDHLPHRPLKLTSTSKSNTTSTLSYKFLKLASSILAALYIHHWTISPQICPNLIHPLSPTSAGKSTS